MQIFGDILPNTFLFFSFCPADLQSFEQSTDDYHTPPALSTWHWPRSCFHLFVTLFEPLVSLKNMCAWHGVISMHFLNHLKCLWRNFPQPDQTFLVYLLFSIHHSSLSAHCWMNWKRGVNRTLWGVKEICYIVPRYIVINNNTIYLSLFCP